MTTANEIAMTLSMIMTAIWTALTGDTFLPSVVGASFALYLRMQANSEPLGRIDIFVSLAVSIAVGLIAGPYVGSQLPHGDGVVGVGALIASFMAVGALVKLHELDWNISDFIAEIAKVFQRGPK